MHKYKVSEKYFFSQLPDLKPTMVSLGQTETAAVKFTETTIWWEQKWGQVSQKHVLSVAFLRAK